MNDVHKLDLVKAKPVEERIKAEVVQLLERYLEEAKRGEIKELFVIALHDNDEWTDRSTSTMHLNSWIGRMEITKLEWIELARRERKETL